MTGCKCGHGSHVRASRAHSHPPVKDCPCGACALESCLLSRRFSVTCMVSLALVVIACMVMAAWKLDRAESNWPRLAAWRRWSRILGGRMRELLPAGVVGHVEGEVAVGRGEHWMRGHLAASGLLAARGRPAGLISHGK
ncbi:hypothetical protein Dimus_025013 [Dionaea muscipula]